MASNTQFLKTSIKGLDAMLSGGIPEKSQILIAGGPGTGKTLLTFEILYRAAKAGVPCAFIALDENPESVATNAKLTFTQFSDIDRLIDSHLLTIEGDNASSKIATTADPETYSYSSMISDMEDIIKSNKAKLVAVDSTSFIKLVLGNTTAYKRSMISIISNLRRMGVTAFLTGEAHLAERTDAEPVREAFLFDGLVSLRQTSTDHNRTFAMEVLKMRGAKHSRTLVSYEITGEGFRFASSSV
jgi:circadian clock protein KaiC